MMILLDTNVISEPMNPVPSPAVMRWIRSQEPDELWTCTIVVAEVLSGLDLMPDGNRQDVLRGQAEYMFSTLFPNRICEFDEAAARAYGWVLKARKVKGRPIGPIDALIAATALATGAAIATRNVSDFAHCGIELVNPWIEER